MIRIPLLTLGVRLATGLAMAAQPQQKLRMIEVSDLESMQKDPKSPPTLLDANEPDFREKNGVIPGAKLLSSFDKYEPARELPADKNAPLVFDCASRL